MTKVAAILGAGIQGCTAALALSKLGFKVNLYDKSVALMNRASLNQEGKIHLGFVYARDPSMITARKMIEHAMQFAPAIESLVGTTLDWEPYLSRRFQCGIHKDSSLTLAEHYAHFNRLQQIYDEVNESFGGHYLGRNPKRIWNDDEDFFRFKGSSMLHAVQTEETAVYTAWVRDILVSAINDNPDIQVYVQHEIAHVEHQHQSFAIFGRRSQIEWKATADLVINCLWEGQHHIDKAMDFGAANDWITRIKYGFILESVPELYDISSLILTHGPFGDIVSYPFDNSIYITWYPACLAYIGQSEQLPAKWEDACEGRHDSEVVSKIYEDSISALSEYVPLLSTLKVKEVLAGSIMGHGKTDISDVHSGLHKRHGIGVEHEGDYYSIFTGKYTSGPANAMALQRMLQ